MKRCPRCQTEKPLGEFNRNRALADGLGTYCRPCSIEYRRDWELAHPESKARRRKPAAPERQCDWCGAWYQPSPHANRGRYCSRAHSNRAAQLKLNYGLTPAAFQLMLVAQDHRCAICGRTPEVWHVDHDHVTNEVRQLLCQTCNNGLGMFGDDPERLEEAIRYLRKHHQQRLRIVDTP